jgi:hypothetical protein
VKEIPVILCLDIEPDEREIDVNVRAPWRGFVETHKLFSELRPRLELATDSPVRLSWFLRMDPQVEYGYGSATWVTDQHREILSDLQLRDDELGLHIHATRWDETAGGWIGDYGNQDWVSTCVRTSFNAFQKALQRPCRSVSFGDRWSNNETVALVERLGAEFYLSIEPGAKPSGEELGYRFTGRWADYRRVPSHPYRPSKANYLQASAKSGRNIWMIPLSAGKYEGPRAFRLWRLKRLAKSWGIDRQRNSESQTLRLHIPPEPFRKTLDGLLKIANASYLAVVVRSDVGAHLQRRANLEQNVEYLRSHPQVRNFRFVTPAEAIDILTNKPVPTGPSATA